ncbi:hypothetical protein ACEPPN_014821 [Leptodophora sp. 'Broadleaf-Isolate-01']
MGPGFLVGKIPWGVQATLSGETSVLSILSSFKVTPSQAAGLTYRTGRRQRWYGALAGLDLQIERRQVELRRIACNRILPLRAKWAYGSRKNLAKAITRRQRSSQMS